MEALLAKLGASEPEKGAPRPGAIRDTEKTDRRFGTAGPGDPTVSVSNQPVWNQQTSSSQAEPTRGKPEMGIAVGSQPTCDQPDIPPVKSSQFASEPAAESVNRSLSEDTDKKYHAVKVRSQLVFQAPLSD